MAHRPLIHRLRIPWLLIVPIVLAVLAVAILVVHADLNIPALYSQCHAREQLPFLSRIRVIGAPSCFLVSLFQLANDSVRSLARMSVILAFVGALLTVSLVESARLSNRPSKVISHPTILWLVFNLIAGTLVWDLVIVPSFLCRAKDVQVARESAIAEEAREADPEVDKAVRGLTSQVEAVAIPIAVAVGFFVPSIAMLVLNHPISIIVWLFFPVWVAIIRYAVKLVGINAITDPQPFHLESHRVPLVIMYAVPSICSVLAHILFIWNLFGAEDRREMTMSTLNFIENDVSIVGLTVVYWLLVEAGIVVILKSIGISILFGPSAGLCASWILREKAIEGYPGGSDKPQGNERNDEETPLLQ